jgi:MYXO-CTERM domain-containing protein
LRRWLSGHGQQRERRDGERDRHPDQRHVHTQRVRERLRSAWFILGIAPIACTPQDNAIAFAFANYHPGFGQDRVLDICETAAQQTGGVWGLDFEYAYVADGLAGSDGSSACNDPMSFRLDCGGEKFYRDRVANTGFSSEEPGTCRATQNSYQMLLALFGPGSPTVVPTASITYPVTGAALDANFPVDVSAGSKRGVWTLNLLLNGYPWSMQIGAPFGADGQQNPSSYTFEAPSSLPMGAYDVVVQACDDVGICAGSAPVTVTYGASCTSDATCAEGQHCNTTSADNGLAPPGGCYWDAPIGELGQSCTYPQFCKTGLCDGTEHDRICTEACTLSSNTCPGDLQCLPNGGSESTTGICFKQTRTGCSTRSSDATWALGSLSALALALSRRRRRQLR